MAITDLGSMQLTATLQHSRWIKIPAGNMYSFLWYWIGTQPTNMFTLNHDTGVVTPTVRGPVGRPYCSIHHPTDNLIYPGIAGNPYESPVISFNPVTGAYTYLHAGPSYSTADGGPQYDGPGNGNITWSDEPHKRVFFYGHYRAGLWAWDPTYAPLDPAGFQDYGIVDNPGGTWAMRYGLSMQVNATHAFVPIYTSGTGLSYLAMVRLSDGVTTTKWKGTSITTITVERGYDEKIYISTKIGAAAAVWYESTDLDTPISTPSPYPGYLRTWVDYTGYSCYESLAIPDGSGNLTIPLNYKKPGDTDWRTVYTDLLDVTPYGIMNAGLDLDNNVVCFSENDGPMTKVVTANNTKTGKGFYPGFSGYSIGADYHRRLEFLGGYSAQAYQYNPALPFVAGTNPHSIILSRMTTDPINPVSGARAYWSCDRMVDGNIWWVAEWRRVTQESQIVWYNPDDQTTGDVGWGVIDSYILENSARNRANTKLLFSGFSGSGGIISIIDVRKKAIIKNITPCGAGATQGRIVSVESNKATTNRFVGIVPLYYIDVTVTGGPKPVAGEVMTGAAHGYTATLWITPGTWTGTIRCYFYNSSSAAFTAENVSFSGGGTGTVPTYMAQAYTAYCVDIKTGALIWGPTAYANNTAIFGSYNAGKNGPVFAHGYVWFYASNNIVRLNPATGAVTTAQAVTAAGGLQWVGDVLYYWDLSTKHIFSVPKADLGV